MTENDARRVSEWLFAPMMHANHKAWAHRELGNGLVAVGFASQDGTWVERWTGSSFKTALNKAARAIIKCMPHGESAVRAQTLLNGGR